MAKINIRQYFRLLPFTIFVITLFLIMRLNNFFDHHTNFPHGTADAEEGSETTKIDLKQQILKKSKPNLVPPPMNQQHDVEVLAALDKRRKELEQAEKKIKEREALVKVMENKVLDQTNKLQEIRTLIEDKIKTKRKESKETIQKLIKIYQAMKPKEAAEIFNDLETDILLDVLKGMPPMKSAPILAKMETEKARNVTELLADKDEDFASDNALKKNPKSAAKRKA